MEIISQVIMVYAVLEKVKLHQIDLVCVIGLNTNNYTPQSEASRKNIFRPLTTLNPFLVWNCF